ncbi:MAG: hypothetical protein IJX78_07680 [Bacilli bacterium]|nr:hypothetical protein [Bacilli bacterium]
MVKLIKKYKELSFEEKCVFSARFSLVFNTLLAIGKIILSFFKGVFFLVSGILNIIIMVSKLECYIGIRNKDKDSFKYHNNLIGLFVILAGIQYAIYMGRMIYSSVEVMEYGMRLGTTIALVSFIELGIAIKGLFNSYGKGHYYRNLKLINLSSALTAMVLTEIAITSFASEADMRFINGIFGLSVGAIICLIGIFILIAPKYSIVDKEHRVYIIKDNENNDEEIKIQLTNSKIYGNYFYLAKKTGNLIEGNIVQEKSPIRKWNIYLKILVIVLSEILIFPYAIGAFINSFKGNKLVKKLDNIMKERGCVEC